ncbi:hypothetical protein C5N99_00540 [Treponema medium]|uniref:Uncharacterized protein n=2 Tax=Treponema medium TaxID=58231 RepID=A0AA87NNZ0_TREMD|nr:MULTISPECIES: hypothetical protein [Treponema]EPF30093.1 hypothetical protein HMPREF9195_00106 [Treponema medium ATCC 700293]QSH91136.1 hypothetical protein C5N99_00540 [Treponema medium]QSH96272.1 hypothetical protein DWB79_00535 [Treponema medium]QUY17461.1 hypothetical protein GWP40_02985 [Treponema vincentii]UTC57315.1 hypothetical protein ABK01_02925 [Treponema sp. OMZ 305]
MGSDNKHFIKVTENALTPLSSEQKVVLNRRGNQLFNEGFINEAQRIFITTGYSDGLTRVGDYYAAKNNTLEALRMYCLAKNKRKSEPIIDSLVRLIRVLIDTEPKGVENV